jgi:hypothetical protein
MAIATTSSAATTTPSPRSTHRAQPNLPAPSCGGPRPSPEPPPSRPGFVDGAPSRWPRLPIRDVPARMPATRPVTDSAGLTRNLPGLAGGGSEIRDPFDGPASARASASMSASAAPSAGITASPSGGLATNLDVPAGGVASTAGVPPGGLAGNEWAPAWVPPVISPARFAARAMAPRARSSTSAGVFRAPVRSISSPSILSLSRPRSLSIGRCLDRCNPPPGHRH